ncbi:MAG: FlxA-like family protein [Cyclobacteriaceae bacterium]|nr:FlxA-like family protein [Cyclobacteriaceae bacterium]
MKLICIKSSWLKKQTTTAKIKVIQNQSRRKTLKVLGSSAIFSSPLASLAAHAMEKPYWHHKISGNRLSFFVRNEERWIVDASKFGASCKLNIQESEQYLDFHLENACLPGSAHPFYFNARVARAPSEKSVFKLAHCKAEMELDFPDWLLQISNAEAECQQDWRLQFNNDSVLGIPAKSRLRMYPDWSMHYTCRSKAKWSYHQRSFEFKKLHFTLSQIRNKDKFQEGFKPLSSIHIDKVEPSAEFLDLFKIDNLRLAAQHDFSFDDVNIYLGQLPGKVPAAVLTAVSGHDLNCQLKTESRHQVLLLTQPSFAIEMQREHSDFILTASNREQPMVLGDGLQNYVIGDVKHKAVFELKGKKGKVLKANYNAQLLATRFEIPGGISLPHKFAQPQKVEINFDKKTSARKKKRDQQIMVHPETGDIEWIHQRGALQFDLLRPEDLVLLTFNFYNCRFLRRNQQGFIQKDNQRQPTYLVIQFQPQHTLEEAFIEGNALPGPSSGATPDLPVRFVRSGASRLVFEMPEDFEGIPATMDQMLDWSKFSLRVNYRARASLPSIQNLYLAPQTTQMRLMRPQTSTPSSPVSPETDVSVTEMKVFEPKTQNLKIARHPRYTIREESVTYQPEKIQQLLPARNLQDFNTNIADDPPRRAFLRLREPDDLDTALEVPARLIISPNQLSHFTHRIQITEKERSEGDSNSNIVELWHTRLGVLLSNGKVDETSLAAFKTIRAIWSSDYGKPRRDNPFRASLDAHQRHYLVEQTSNYNIKNYTPRPVKAKKLMLSTLGAWADFHADFDFPDREGKNLPLLEWEHRATMGRDHFVKVAEAGYLYPFGHKAAIVTITERKMDANHMAAVNRQRMFIVVREPVKSFMPYGPENEFMGFPFQKIMLRTTATPDIDAPQNLLNIPIPGNRKDPDLVYNFWINVNNQPFYFDFQCIDRDGLISEMRLPLIFIGEAVATSAQHINSLNNAYASAQIQRRRSLFRGQLIGYAESLLPDDTVMPTDEMDFLVRTVNAAGSGSIRFAPVMEKAKVHVKSLEELLNLSLPVDIRLFDDRNPSGVFAEFISAIPLDFNGLADRAGAFICPNAPLTALSRVHGVVAGKIEDIASLQFNALDFFNNNLDLGGLAKIFGVIPIHELLQTGLQIQNQVAQYVDTIQQLVAQLRAIRADIENARLLLEEAAEQARFQIQQEIQNLQAQLLEKQNQLQSELLNHVPRIPGLKIYKKEDAVVVEYTWQPVLKPNLDIFDILRFKVDDTQNSLSIFSRVERPFDTSRPTLSSVESRLQSFHIELKNILRVSFASLDFVKLPGEKANVKVSMAGNKPIVFLGPLTFVNGLQRLIPGDGFAKGPHLDIQPSGIRAGYELGIPSVEVGILSIANIALGARMQLPFTGAPLSFAFNFCRRENPFLLTVSCFGGGGFFALENSVRGLMMMEAAFEFGASVSINLGIASGGASVMGGFYFKMEIENESGNTLTQLCGYLRINGHLSVMGLISLAMEFFLALSYVIRNNKSNELYGEASIKVKISVLFFKKTVSVTARRTLKGADADPTFAEMIEPQDWLDYCRAFA